MPEVRYVGRAATIRIPGGTTLTRLTRTTVSDELAGWLEQRPDFVVERPAELEPEPARRAPRALRPFRPATDVTEPPIPTSSEAETDASAANETPDAAEGDQRDA
jgi:hypothetical protein